MNITSSGSAAALQQLQKTLFPNADVDGDDQLSFGELQSGGNNLQGLGSNDQAKSLNGQASSGQGFKGDTLSSLISLLQTFQTSQAGAADKGHEGGATAAFDQSDTDGDGKLSADELTAGMSAHAPAGADVSQKVADLIGKADTNGDGALSLDETKAAKPHGHAHGGGGAPPAASAGSDDATDPADLNGDGTVDAAEYAKSQQATSPTLSGDVTSQALDLMQKVLTQLSDALNAKSGSSVSATA